MNHGCSNNRGLILALCIASHHGCLVVKELREVLNFLFFQMLKDTLEFQQNGAVLINAFVIF